MLVRIKCAVAIGFLPQIKKPWYLSLDNANHANRINCKVQNVVQCQFLSKNIHRCMPLKSSKYHYASGTFYTKMGLVDFIL